MNLKEISILKEKDNLAKTNIQKFKAEEQKYNRNNAHPNAHHNAHSNAHFNAHPNAHHFETDEGPADCVYKIKLL